MGSRLFFRKDDVIYKDATPLIWVKGYNNDKFPPPANNTLSYVELFESNTRGYFDLCKSDYYDLIRILNGLSYLHDNFVPVFEYLNDLELPINIHEIGNSQAILDYSKIYEAYGIQFGCRCRFLMSLGDNEDEDGARFNFEVLPHSDVFLEKGCFASTAVFENHRSIYFGNPNILDGEVSDE